MHSCRYQQTTASNLPELPVAEIDTRVEHPNAENAKVICRNSDKQYGSRKSFGLKGGGVSNFETRYG